MLKQLQTINQRAISAKKYTNPRFHQLDLRIAGIYTQRKSSQHKNIKSTQHKNSQVKCKKNKKQNIPKMKCSQKIIFMDEFPKTSIKFKKKALPEMKMIERMKPQKIETPRIASSHCEIKINLRESNKSECKPGNYGMFFQAIAKIFKDLDIFNRKQISQININKWIPEGALYFLGSIFQKIKTQKLSLTLPQFTSLCYEIYQNSSSEDVNAFIAQINCQIHTNNVTLQQETEQDKLNQSKVYEKINLQQKQSEYRPALHELKNQEIQALILKLQQKDKNVHLKLRQARERQKQYNISGRNYQMEACEGWNENVFNFPLKETKRDNLNNNMTFYHVPRQFQYTEQEISRQQLSNSLAFKVINQTTVNGILKRETSPEKKTSKENGAAKRVSFSCERTILNSCERTILNESLQKKAFQNENEEKIDRLSNKLEEYLKQNALKIQKSRAITKECRNNPRVY